MSSQGLNGECGFRPPCDDLKSLRFYHPHHPSHPARCGFPCHGAAGEVTIRQEPGDERGHPSQQPPLSGGGRRSPREGVPADPWDVLEILRGFCTDMGGPGGGEQPLRKDSYLPYLLLRANPRDRGDRPLPPGIPFWESPDVFVVPSVRAQDAPGLPVTFGSFAEAGGPNTLYAHVWNLGKAPAFDVRVEFYSFNPALGIEAAAANRIGFTCVTLGSRRSGRSHAVVKCPADWVPAFGNDGHACLVVRAYTIISDWLGPDEWDARLNRHVAQRKIAATHPRSR